MAERQRLLDVELQDLEQALLQFLLPECVAQPASGLPLSQYPIREIENTLDALQPQRRDAIVGDPDAHGETVDVPEKVAIDFLRGFEKLPRRVRPRPLADGERLARAPDGECVLAHLFGDIRGK